MGISNGTDEFVDLDEKVRIICCAFGIQGCVFPLEMKLISADFLIKSFRRHHLHQYLSDFYDSKCI